MDVISLQAPGSSIPYLDRTVFATCDHPFAFTVERHARDITGMAFEGHDRIRVCGSNIVQPDIVSTSRCQKLLIRCDAESVDLGFGMLNGPRTDTREGLPEAVNSIKGLIPR